MVAGKVDHIKASGAQSLQILWVHRLNDSSWLSGKAPCSGSDGSQGTGILSLPNHHVGRPQHRCYQSKLRFIFFCPDKHIPHSQHRQALTSHVLILLIYTACADYQSTTPLFVTRRLLAATGESHFS